MRNLSTALVGLLLLASACQPKPTDQSPSAGPAAQATPGYTPIQIDSAQLKTLVPGLQVFVAKQGTGQLAKVGDEVIVHYHGRLTNGQVFDSSFLRGAPYNVQGIGTGQVIQGWDKAIPTLPVGTRAVLVIAPELGYGSQGSGPIPPNSTLVFDVEILGVNPNPNRAPAQ